MSEYNVRYCFQDDGNDTEYPYLEPVLKSLGLKNISHFYVFQTEKELIAHCKKNKVPVDYCNGGFTGTITEQEFALLCLETNILS